MADQYTQESQALLNKKHLVDNVSHSQTPMISKLVGNTTLFELAGVAFIPAIAPILSIVLCVNNGIC